MKPLNISHIDPEDEIVIFKGIFYKLAPLTIPVTLLIVAQNILILRSYYRDRARFIPGLFLRIAFADILKAQGELVLCVVSIFVFTGLCDVKVLYCSLFYYMVTTSPAINCSKIFNMALSIVLTINVVDPFRNINTDRLKKLLFYLCSVVTGLHVLDAIVSVVVFVEFSSDFPLMFLFVVVNIDVPGLATLVSGICWPEKSHDPHVFVCSDDYAPHPWDGRVLRTFYGAVVGLYSLGPVITILTCMVIQLKYLWRLWRDQVNSEESRPGLDARHVAVTVFLISLLFFFCHVSYLVAACVWLFLHTNFNLETWDKKFFIEMGEGIGVVEFILPLVYALLYPLIIVSRKQELRESSCRFLRRVFGCLCRSSEDVSSAESTE